MKWNHKKLKGGRREHHILEYYLVKFEEPTARKATTNEHNCAPCLVFLVWGQKLAHLIYPAE
jgi:hypothetical protein